MRSPGRTRLPTVPPYLQPLAHHQSWPPPSCPVIRTKMVGLNLSSSSSHSSCLFVLPFLLKAALNESWPWLHLCHWESGGSMLYTHFLVMVPGTPRTLSCVFQKPFFISSSHPEALLMPPSLTCPVHLLCVRGSLLQGEEIFACILMGTTVHLIFT